jgi:MFS transporter, PAT family, beta-lactamase induction signal transducer AmpG
MAVSDTLKEWRAAAAVYFDRRVLVVLFLGFSGGLPLALTGSTLSVWLREGGVSRAAIGAFALVSLPYALKFLWSPLVDRLNLPFLTARFGRRRGWALLTQACLGLALLALGTADPTVDLWRTAWLAVVVAFCSASQDIVIDAYRVESLDERRQGAGAAVYVLGYRFGMLASGAGALFIAAGAGWATAYFAMAGLVGIGMLTVLRAPEPKVAASAESRAREAHVAAWLESRPHLHGRKAEMLAWFYGAVVAPFAQFTTRPAWALVLAFIAVYKLGDVLAGVMASTFYVDLGFSKEEIAGVTKVFGLWATIVGGLAGGLLVGKVGTVRALMIGGVLQMISNLGFALLATAGADLSVLAAVVAVENFTGGVATAAFVAYLSGLCDAAYTATQYALLSSFFKLGGDLLGANAGWLAEKLEWFNFFLFSTAGALPGLLLLTLLLRVNREQRLAPATG